MLLWIFISIGAFAHDVTVTAEIKTLLKQFDQELERTPRAAWSLGTSTAYQRLYALRVGRVGARFAPLGSASSRITTIAPGPGKSGQITGGEFPAKTWAITFDDGPHKSRTAPILQVLKAHTVPATFFWLAQNVERLPAVVTQTELFGHSVQNHSYTHADLMTVTDLSLGFEISVANHKLNGVYRRDAHYFRLPYGSGSDDRRVRAKVASERLISVLWNVDSLDWADKNPVSVAERVRKQMLKLGRGIVLFHDIQAHTATATDRLLRALAGSRLTYKTVPEVVEQINGR